MIQVQLPDGSSRELDENASAADLAAQIGPGLAKAAVAAVVSGEVRDLSQPLEDGAQVRLLTKRDSEALEVLRHSAAHLMADAILRVFPQAQLAIGPVVEDGFYYDIYMPEGTITPEDFPKLEAEMKCVAKEAHAFERCAVHDKDADEAFVRYRAIDGGDNPFKRELVGEIEARGEDITLYRHGDFVDLCRGPHVPNTGWLKHVKLTAVSGAYWRADAEREQLVRIYGTAFFGKQELAEHLRLLEEARKRDHRVLGEQLDLFHFEEDAPGFPFFHAKGALVFNLLVDTMRGLLRRRGYHELKTPLVLSEKLWHVSGHYDHYMENMFFTKLKLRDPENSETIHDNVEEQRPMAVKPMNCPGHVLVYRHRNHSHNEFPLRYSEMGLVHRRELSGVRHGLFRVQAFTQDDAHHFCTPEQLGDEIGMLIDFFKEVYGLFGLEDVRIELSTRPEKSIGSKEIWERAETALREALDADGIEYQVNEGDGAFYGPKIDFHIRDVLKRSWQCGTIQLDFSMPDRFGCTYVGADGQKHTPVMIHRACYGSVERFLGILIEHYGGRFPTWLAPVQVLVIPVSAKFVDYARSVHEKLLDAGLRADVNLKDDRVGYKIRESSLQKIPYVIVVGEREMERATVSPRSHDGGELDEMTLDGFLALLAEETTRA
ncbi:MAG: threonine--tRNA ligase [Myxococcota bacterium]|jgi:threonyl-tRNA synthetase|nr:threonine--tRNA ligase [Deltaproteobacteria bacterium]MCP4241763.1 threonine--tRNA ligase [bacterium]MDP6075972.1 threonine--tRNA ligase [Myxococcota bacterium]MDP6242355.1 threonine--tRNA ligase [Myxococcota bacterium]MDP7076050.1 threonine--tRNA ligase [Myxococcota bacterium]